MTRYANVDFKLVGEQAYAQAYDCHGDLKLDSGVFLIHLGLIIEKHLGTDPPWPTASEFFNGLHTSDLYVSAACAQKSQVAWEYFASCYRAYIYEVARYSSRSTDAAREVADYIIANLFFPDREGCCHIASFDGRISLAAWLRAVVTYQALKERKRKCNAVEPLEDGMAIADEASIGRIEDEVRASRYGSMVRDSLKGASQALSAQERAILLLRYEEELRAAEIARILQVHPSTVTRQLQSIQQKIKQEVVSILASRYNLTASAITECLTDIVENPSYSILALVK